MKRYRCYALPNPQDSDLHKEQIKALKNARLGDYWTAESLEDAWYQTKDWWGTDNVVYAVEVDE